MGRLDVAVEVVARAGGVDAGELRALAPSAEVAARLEVCTGAFETLRVSQRPTSVLENTIGDRAVFSGVVRMAPSECTVQARRWK